MTNSERQAVRTTAACPAGTSEVDALTLDLLRTWRQLWAQLGQLQQAARAADGCVACPVAQLRGGWHG